jgi:hypothetical protein
VVEAAAPTLTKSAYIAIHAAVLDRRLLGDVDGRWFSIILGQALSGQNVTTQLTRRRFAIAGIMYWLIGYGIRATTGRSRAA